MGRQNQQDSSRGDKEYLCHMLELFPHLSFIYFPLHQSSSKDTDGYCQPYSRYANIPHIWLT